MSTPPVDPQEHNAMLVRVGIQETMIRDTEAQLSAAERDAANYKDLIAQMLPEVNALREAVDDLVGTCAPDPSALPCAALVQQCYVERICATDPASVSGYYFLGDTIPAGGGSVLLNDGRTLNKQELYEEAVSCDPHCGGAYNGLGDMLPPGGKITLKDGRTLTKQQLFMEAIHCKPELSHAYTQKGGRTLSHAYNGLGSTLPVNGSITLKDGRTLTKQQLFMEAIHCDPKFSHAYNGLGDALPAGGKITLKDGRTLTKQQLFMEAIDCDGKNSSAHNSLGATLPAGGSITLKDGRLVGREWLLSVS